MKKDRSNSILGTLVFLGTLALVGGDRHREACSTSILILSTKAASATLFILPLVLQHAFIHWQGSTAKSRAGATILTRVRHGHGTKERESNGRHGRRGEMRGEAEMQSYWEPEWLDS